MSRIVRPAGIVCLCVLAQCMAMCPSDYGLPGYGINLGEQRRCLSVVAAKMSSVPWNANWLGTANKICSNLFESGRLANLTTFPPLPQLFNNAWALSLNGSFVIVGGCALRSSRMKNAQIESDGFPLHTDNYGYSKCSPKIVRQFLQTLGSIHYHRGSNVSRYGLIGMGLRNSRDKLLLICAYYELGRAEAAPNYFACTNKSFPVDYVACEHPTLQQACIGVDKQGKECRCAPGRRGPFCAAYDVTREERYRRSFSAMVFRTPDCRGFCPEHALCTPKDPKSSSTTYYCQCHWAYNGENCENKWSQCHLSKFCIPHGWCKDTIFKLPSGTQYSHTCICDAGWTGADCMTDIDECLSNPCQNSGTCLDAVNTFACECQLGYTGLLCEKDLNECLNDPCVNGRCINEFGSFACDCYHGYTGKNCEIEINECDSNPCHYGTCHDLPNSYFCVCMDGFTGHHCETPINECVSNPCKNNGTCVKKARGFICQCPAHIKGRLCDGGTTMCSTNPCKAGGTCKPTKEGFECRCRIGRTGETCEKDINECLQRPCKNNGQCVDGDGMYTCRCMDGFVGVSCEIDVDECLGNPCGPRASCVNVRGSYECICDDHYEGIECEKVKDPCIPNPCLHGGTCAKKLETFACTCTAEYTGKRCDTATSGCAQEPCMFGRCEYKSSSPFCLCDRGFTGERCDMRINFCKDIQCTQNARCVSSLDGYYCECNPGFTGQQCETYYVGACRFPEVCINGGTCVVKGDTFQCQCLPSFTGETCEIEVISTPEREAEHNKKGLPKSAIIFLLILCFVAICSFAVGASIRLINSEADGNMSLSVTGETFSDKSTRKWWKRKDKRTKSPHSPFRRRLASKSNITGVARRSDVTIRKGASHSKCNHSR